MKLLIRKQMLEDFGYLLMFIMFMRPGGVQYIPLLDIIFDVGRVLATGIICLLYFRIRHKSGFVLMLVLQYAVLLFATCMYGGSIFAWLKSFGSVVCAAMLMELVLRKRRINALFMFQNYMIFMILANIVSVILLYPNGFGQTSAGTPEYLLGIDNRFFFFFLPAVYITGINSLLRYDKINAQAILVYLICIGTLIWFWSVGAMLCMLAFIGYYIFVYKKNVQFLFNIRTYLIIILIAFVVFVVQQNFSMFEYIIVNILHKDMTFSARTGLWRTAIDIYMENPLIGIGFHGDLFLHTIFGKVTHPHNHFLYILYTSGTIGGAAFFAALFCSAKELLECAKCNLSQFMSFTIFVLFFALTADTFDYASGLTIMLAMATNIKYLLSMQGSVNKTKNMGSTKLVHSRKK